MWIKQSLVGLGIAAAIAAVAACCAERAPYSTTGSEPLRLVMTNSQGNRVSVRQVLPPALFTNLTLLMLSRDGRPMPGLAAAWQTSDRRVWTLNLPTPERPAMDRRQGTRGPARARTAPRRMNPVFRDLESEETSNFVLGQARAASCTIHRELPHDV